MNDFDARINDTTNDFPHSVDLSTLQINIGLKCNQRCKHCHLACSPEREEEMSWQTIEMVIDVANRIKPSLIDITGGSPELNPNFKKFIKALRAHGHRVQTRTNLAIYQEEGFRSIPDFLRDHGIELVGSLPCYLEENVCRQRGEGVYKKSIASIKTLNKLGYGRRDELPLGLVYNPGGPFLPSDQTELEAAYRKELNDRFGIVFTNLLTITNMPIGHFLDEIRASNQESEYNDMLRKSFNPKTIDGLMCRHQVNIGWDGTLYDCDFNMALGMSVNHGAPNHISHFNSRELEHRRIVTGDHCFGCTAGSGSSCGGAITKE
jgi:radical SAM/Cys-rich protein